jgi:hypothetical protein
MWESGEKFEELSVHLYFMREPGAVLRMPAESFGGKRAARVLFPAGG